MSRNSNRQVGADFLMAAIVEEARHDIDSGEWCLTGRAIPTEGVKPEEWPEQSAYLIDGQYGGIHRVRDCAGGYLQQLAERAQEEQDPLDAVWEMMQ